MRSDLLRSANQADWPAIQRLLTDSALPLAGAREHLDGFIVAVDGGVITGCGALERHGSSALLRSIAVNQDRRGSRIGERIVRRLIGDACSAGIESLVLLTTTAAHWFPRFGFQTTARDSVPLQLTDSEEFRGACPASAVVMLLEIS